MELWNKETEIDFFSNAHKFATLRQLFYVDDNRRYVAYWPKGYKGKKATLQSRNALIGDFTEKWSTDLLQRMSNEKNLFAVRGAICEEIALSKQSPADVIISKKSEIVQNPEDILAIFEVKMSVVWNWEYKAKSRELICLGDYKSHTGNPGLLRSDSMLKAIGKSINIRVASQKSSKIPIIVLGNTPIALSYYPKVDHLKTAGVIQGFWSVNPSPTEDKRENLKSTPKGGFYKFDNFNELRDSIDKLLSRELNFFSAMKSKKELGKIIEEANKKARYEEKAEEFLKLIGE